MRSPTPEQVVERLEELRRLYVPRTHEVEPVEHNLSPAAVAARLEELRALFELTAWLQGR